LGELRETDKIGEREERYPSLKELEKETEKEVFLALPLT
jgi:hypothetical protein